MRAVAFDLGGVLADVDHEALGRHLGAPRADIEAAFFEGDAHRRLTTGHLALPAFIRRASDRLALPQTSIDAAWRAMVTVSPGAASLVEQTLARVPVTVWSNTDPLHWAVVAEDLPWALTDPATRCLSFEVGARKPHARFFQAGLERLGAHPEEVLYLDDRPDHVAGAAALGIHAELAVGLDEAAAILDKHLAP